MKWLKFILWCSIMALVGVVLAKWAAFGQEVVTTGTKLPEITIQGGVSGAWLTVNRINKSDPLGKGFDPSMTYLISEFKPVVKPLQNGKFLIQFECSICGGLP